MAMAECFLCKEELLHSPRLPEDSKPLSFPLRQQESKILVRLLSFLHEYSPSHKEHPSTSAAILRSALRDHDLLRALDTQLQHVRYCKKCTTHIGHLYQTFQAYDRAGKKLEVLKDELVDQLKAVTSESEDDVNSHLRHKIITGFKPTKPTMKLEKPEGATELSECKRCKAFNPVIKLHRIDSELPAFAATIHEIPVTIKQEPETENVEVWPDIDNMVLGLGTDPDDIPGSPEHEPQDTESSDSEYDPDETISRSKQSQKRGVKRKGKVRTDRKSKRRSIREEHRIHSGYYPCDFDNCTREFDTAANLEQHVCETHTEAERSWRCDQNQATCQAKFFKESTLTQHTHFVHSKTYKYPCPKCLEGFDTYHKILTHQLRHHGKAIGVRGKPVARQRTRRRKGQLPTVSGRVHFRKPVFPCDFESCEFRGLDEWETQDHLQKMHPEVQRPYNCSQCTARFIFEERLGRHKHWAHSASSFPCQDCDFATECGHKLDRHRLRTHGKGEPCPYKDCNYVGTKGLLKVHLSSSVHADQAPDHPDQRKHMCQHCGAAFWQPQRLKHHIISRHPELAKPEELKKYRCEVCDKMMCDPASLRGHMRSVHNQIVKPDQVNCYCDECGRSFVNMTRLRVHKQSHLTPDQFEHECEICHAKFRKRGKLTDHMRRHTGNFKHICKECGKKFITAGTLGRHMKIHAGILAHVCPHCNKGFPIREYLTTHLKSHLSKEEKEELKRNKPEAPPLQKIYHDLWRKRSTVASVAAVADSQAEEPVAVPEYTMHFDYNRKRRQISRVLSPEELEGGGDEVSQPKTELK